MNLIKIFLFSFFVILCSCGERDFDSKPTEKMAGLTQVDSVDWKSYKNDTFGYSINYPSNWAVIEAHTRLDTFAAQERDILTENMGESELQKVTFVEKSEDKFWPGEFQIAVIKNSNGMTLSKWVQNIRIEDVSGGDLITERENDTIAFRSSKRLKVFEFDGIETIYLLEHNNKFMALSFISETPNDPHLIEHTSIYKNMLLYLKLVE